MAGYVLVSSVRLRNDTQFHSYLVRPILGSQSSQPQHSFFFTQHSSLIASYSCLLSYNGCWLAAWKS